ncbi:hypothetical protein PLESTB_000940800 [Pleodorina starrii]|uniref:RRM domain-containing protein n=1 Tax=Pleodorina starrii TaxID=330485 RepID=A0A9W6BN12_9CHLO|nr:hypothetical protein PLESTM_000704400 [Pleodorina starrii]GLC55074.1 hypothetical protein PLESTB_000940800 [Pleodorina starrii]GLC71171.1 hypothetical protein PLESTF_001082100 [Pleodorina starrii]
MAINNNKKRKLQHATDATGAKTEKSGGANLPSEDPRFQMNSDFSDSDGEEEIQAGAGEGPAAGGQQPKRPSGSTPAGAMSKQQRQQQQQQRQAGAERQQGDSSHRAKSDSAAEDDGAGVGEDGVSGDEGDEDHGGGHPPSSSGDEKDDENEAMADGKRGSERGGVDGEDAAAQAQGEEKRPNRKVLSKRKLERVKEASDRRGIVYLSRIPPHMKPHKLRQLLEPFGDIGRVYCAPEDPALRRMRKKKGGNSGKNFTEGWVEFEDKRRAKRAALALNGQPIGGSKRSAYHYDLWTIKYLPKFKWDTLTEEINYQRAVREQRLVAEISAAKRERDFYLSRVDKAKAIDAIQERRRTKQQQQQEQAGGSDAAATGDKPAGEKVAGAPAAAAAAAPAGGGPRFERHFGQRRAKADPVLDDRSVVLAEDVLGLLGGKRKAQQTQK